MAGVDELLGRLGEGDGVLAVLAVALVLGLRHATDPDHLVAVSTLLATSVGRPLRRACALGLAWGAGHGTTVLGAGLPVVLLGAVVPRPLTEAAEVAVGALVAALALRLLVLWRRGLFHAHVHAHGELRHRHLHGHADDHARGSLHEHGHEPEHVRSLSQAFAVGLVHGMAGSAAITVLVLATVQGAAASAALVTFTVGSAFSMALFSVALGYVLAHGPLRASFRVVAPTLGVASAGFGVWYAAAAIAAA
ncbi:MAG: hypothetical protein M3327_06735 [Actinomycetota bacterium]|nr:hypothetical protein [Actinomycetota bacterium]